MTTNPDRDPVEKLAEEFIARYRKGERPPISEYADRYPELADKVRKTFPALVMMEELAPGDGESFAQPAVGLDLAEDGVDQQVLGDYRIIREIGRGGMGVVYEAEQISLGRHVALKVLPRQTLANPIQKKRFEREARAAAQLHHTNIVPVFGVGEDDSVHYYVMQFIQGMSLYDVLLELKQLRDTTTVGDDSHSRAVSELSLYEVVSAASWGLQDSTAGRTDATASPSASGRGGESPTVSNIDTTTGRISDTFSLSKSAILSGELETTDRGATNYWQSVARIGMQVADALEYAHGQGVSHRDIKPSNLLLDTRGTVWITDFGLAKTDDQENLTQTGDIVGTLRYMAPESFDGNTDARSDIYSLGLTLYELLAMRPAFDEVERNRLVRQVTDGEPTRLRKINPEIPRDLETIIHKAIERGPNDRIQTAGEMAADLRRFLDDEPIRARRVGLVERTWRWCRRNPGISVTTALASVVVVATVAIAFVLINHKREEAVQLAGKNDQLAKVNAHLVAEERAAKKIVEAALRKEKEALEKEAKLHLEAVDARDVAKTAARDAKVVTDFLILDMIGLASPERSQGQPLSVRDLLDRAAVRVGRSFADQPRREASVREAIGRAYYYLGAYQPAHEHLTAAVELRRRVLGAEHLDTLKVTANLAALYHGQGKYAEAETLQREALEILKRVHGANHTDTLSALGNLAANLHGQGKYTEAQELFEAALKSKQETLGPDDPKTLATMSNLAVNLDKQGKFESAESLHQRVVESKRQLFGDKHPSTLRSLGNLASNMAKQRRYAEARRLHEQVLQTQRQILGVEHPHTLSTMNNLAVTLNAQGESAAAQKLFGELTTIFRRRLGSEHPNTLATMGNFAACYRDLGRFAEAEKSFNEVVGVSQRVLGKEHPSTLQLKDSLARTLHDQRKFDEARALFQEILETNRRVHGADHISSLSSAHPLAALLLDQGLSEQADSLLQTTLPQHHKVLPKGHWLIGNVECLMGRSKLAADRYADAELLLLSGYETMKNDYRTPARRLRDAAVQIVALYQAWNKPDQAAEWKRRLNDQPKPFQRKTSGPNRRPQL